MERRLTLKLMHCSINAHLLLCFLEKAEAVWDYRSQLVLLIEWVLAWS